MTEHALKMIADVDAERDAIIRELVVECESLTKVLLRPSLRGDPKIVTNAIFLALLVINKAKNILEKGGES